MGLQVAADLAGVVGVGLVEGDVFVQLGHGGAEALEGADLVVQVGQSLGEQTVDVLARRATGVPDVEDLANVGESETCGAPTADEIQTGDDLRREVRALPPDLGHGV